MVTESKGLRIFNKCPLKEVEYVEDHQQFVGAQLNCPVTQDKNVPLKVNAQMGYKADVYGKITSIYSYSDVYKSPDSEEQVYVYKGIDRAYEHLGRTAGQVICGTCTYVNLDPTAVSIRRTAQAQQRLEIALNEKSRLEDLAGLKQAHEEIDRLATELGTPSTLPERLPEEL